ncbi:hypothetical protein ACWXVT_00620 [Mycoplasma sp. 1573]
MKKLDILNAVATPLQINPLIQDPISAVTITNNAINNKEDINLVKQDDKITRFIEKIKSDSYITDVLNEQRSNKKNNK